MKTSFVLLLVLAASVHAQSPGAFTATGNMITPRFGHTATLLDNGKVLIAGGGSGAVELYDPFTRTFTATGAMTASRVVGSATLLPDGRVLLIEGGNAELYDPSTGSVTATGSMIDGSGRAATLLTNGKVLISGLFKPELYDPSTGMFTIAGPYASAYTHEDAFETTATLLPSGEVLFAADVQYVRNYGAELYDSTTNTFRLTGAMVNYFNGRTTNLLVNGKVLRAGGTDDFGRYQKAEQYDPATGKFTATGDMTTPRSDHAAVLLPDGAVLITGGFGQGTTATGNCCAALGSLANAELYDSSSGTFTATGSMTARRAGHTATLLNDGRVLIAGGAYSGGVYPVGTGIFYGFLSSAEIYTPPVLIPAPALFSISDDGRGQGAIWHAQTGQIASADNPATAGEALSMYTISLPEGGVIPPQVFIGGRLAQVLYLGAAPGFPGYNQVNFLLPGGVPPGPAVPVRLTYIGRSSNAVTVGVQ
jgi:hypothetical protein